MRTRDFRRAERERAIARGRRKAKAWGWPTDPQWIELWARRYASTRHPCSGWCCGNPRRWFGDLTLQERRAEQMEAT